MTLEKLNEILSKYDDNSSVDSLVNELNSMSSENLSTFLTRYADLFLNDSEPKFTHANVVAKSMNAGHEINFVDNLARIDYAEAVRQSNIRIMQDKHVIHTEQDYSHQGLQSAVFAQTHNLKQENLPVQGWKFHISAENIEDYHALYSIVVPELDKLGVAFKTVKPEQFMAQLADEQTGKALTIYPGPGFDLSKLSKEAQDFLTLPPHMQKSRTFINEMGATQLLSNASTKYITPNGDTQVWGRIFARYGRFKKAHGDACITSPEGKVELDPKAYRNHKPQFSIDDSPKGILYFYSEIEKKFQETKDRKTFMQEYYTMSHCDGKSHAYMMFEINPNDAKLVSQLLGPNVDPNSMCTVVQGVAGDNKTYLMMHQSALQNTGYLMQSVMQSGGHEFKRPVWDVQINKFEIPAYQVQLAQSIAQAMANTYGQSFAGLSQTKDGQYVIKCDSSLSNVFFDYCKANGLQCRDFQEPAKNPLVSFLEKTTGRNFDNDRDITFQPLQYENNYVGEDR